MVSQGLNGGEALCSLEIVLIQELEVLAILKGGGGPDKFYRLEPEGVAAIFPFSSPPFPIINDRSLTQLVALGTGH